jgi:hypothetical protein
MYGAEDNKKKKKEKKSKNLKTTVMFITYGVQL